MADDTRATDRGDRAAGSVRQRIVFFGSPAFAIPSLEAVAAEHDLVALVTRPDRPSGRGMRVSPPPAKEAALCLGVPIEQPETLRDSAVVQRLSSLAPDLFVVVAYGRILPVALLEVPRRGPWNLHASLLPQYRGAAPIPWAIIRGEQRTGVCVMRMEAGLDTGPVAARTETPIGDDETAGALSDRLAVIGAELLIETIRRIATGTVALDPQDRAQATLAPFLRKEDGQIDFRASAHQVACRTRGVDPWPGAQAFLGDEVFKLFRPKVIAARGDPGRVLGLVPEGLAVACGEGAVAFAELQLPGRKRLPAAGLLAGRLIPTGSALRLPNLPDPDPRRV